MARADRYRRCGSRALEQRQPPHGSAGRALAGGWCPSIGAVTTPTVGRAAPAIVLQDQTGESVNVKSANKGRRVLVFFYPKANTPGCTTQACGLRDIADQIGDTVIIGISPDTPTRQAHFDEKFSLGFTLLADVDHAVAEAYGVWVEKSMYGRKYMGVQRSAFLIDEKGKISHAWPKISPKDTPTNLLRALSEC